MKGMQPKAEEGRNTPSSRETLGCNPRRSDEWDVLEETAPRVWWTFTIADTQATRDPEGKHGT